MPTNWRKIARSIVPGSPRLHPIRGLDGAILLGLLRAIGAVDSRHRTDGRSPAVQASARGVPAQGGVAARNESSIAEAEQESHLESAGVTAGAGGAYR